MKIKKYIAESNPLLLNTEYRWEECFAKFLLESIFPHRFEILECRERPDLQNIDLGIGVEITAAIPQRENEKDNLFTMLIRGNVKNIDKAKEKIRKLGGKYNEEGLMMRWVGYRDLSNIYNALRYKLSTYKEFKNQYLLITDENYIKNEELTEVMKTLNRIQECYNKKFSSIFIYLYGGKLIEFNMKSETYSVFFVSNPGILNFKAKQMVVHKEIESINHNS